MMRATSNESGRRPPSNGAAAVPTTQLSRRLLLGNIACGFGGLALAGLCSETQAARRTPLAHKQPHFPARAKRMIFLFMQGGPSQVDTFDYKPALQRADGRKIEFHVARTMKVTPERVFKSPWRFDRYGENGHWVSELFPHMAQWAST